MKWYEKVIVTIFIIIISPLMVFLFICMGIAIPFIAISNRFAYKKSAYYKNFKTRYNKEIFSSNEYVFYNYADREKLQIKYVKQEEGSLNYFIYNNERYIFPDFNEVRFNNETNLYEVVFRKNKTETSCSLDKYLESKNKLFEDNKDLPLRLLISRNYFSEGYIDLDSLPKSLYVIRNYNFAFKDENKEILSLIPQNTKDLYQMMSKNDKLCGKFELVEDEVINWTFEKVIYKISIEKNDGIIEVLKNNKHKSYLTHWHPDDYGIYEDICNIGEKGNVIVIKTFLGSASVLYMGSGDKCPYRKDKFHLGKLYFFESK